MLVVLFTLLSIINAEVRLSGIIRSRMVLQIPYPKQNVPPTNIFGTGLLNETIYINGTSGFPSPLKATPECTDIPNCVYGNFSIPIIPDINDKSFPGPYNITIQSINNNNIVTGSIILTDVVFGDVFLCGGQSNMAYEMGHCANYEYEKSISPNYNSIRMFMADRTQNDTAQQNVTYYNGYDNKYNWLPAGLDSDGNMYDFSCICYTFGRILTDWLRNTSNYTPYIGLIESDTGGTSVYLWASPIAGIACNLTGELPYSGELTSIPGNKWNAQINPIGMFGKGLSIRSIIYYQGEADSGENDDLSATSYTCLLNGLIYTWRLNFNQSNLPFINIQLPNGHDPSYYNDDICTKNGWNGFQFAWNGIQVAQNNVYNIQSNTGLVTCQDYGQDTLHYSYKTEVSKRVYLWARYLVYNDKTVTKKHLKYGIIPLDNNNDSVNHPDPPIFNVAYKTEPNNLTILVNISNTGPNGIYLQPAYNCSTFPNNGYGPNMVCINNCSEILYCCDMNGGVTVKFRLDGWYWYKKTGDNDNHRYIGLNGWYPGMVTNIINNGDNTSTVVTEPILPQYNCTDYPRNGMSFIEFELISVRQIELGTSNDCVWSNSYGIPISKGGPYDIIVENWSSP